jgi:hypothetical protein
VPRVIATAHCSYRRPHNNVTHRGRVRPPQRDPMGGGNKRRKDRGHEKSGSEAGEPAGHRLQSSYFLFPAPARGEKAKLGRESRREKRLISLISRAGLSTDRDGTDDDLSEGGFSSAIPPISGTTGVAHEPRSGMFDSTSSSWPALLISDPAAVGARRVSWRLATSYISYCIQRKYA